MKLSYVGVDLAKNVFQVHGVNRQGQAVWRRQLRRAQWLKVLRETVEPGCIIGMEACASAHHWARQLQTNGYEVRLVAPQFVKPFVKSNKNDRNDAEAICEAITRPHMRFVPVKTIEQQDIQAIHRVRGIVMSQRNAKANQIRGLVAEYGIVAPQQILSLRRAVPEWLEDAENGLSTCFRTLLHDMWMDLQHMQERLADLDRQIEQMAKDNPVTLRLQQLRGVGPMVATALVAAVGDGSHFRKGRQMAAAIGLTPRQHSSGEKHRLLGISKRGDTYLRTLLIHGARAVVSQAKRRDDPLSRWVIRIAERSHPNVAALGAGE